MTELKVGCLYQRRDRFRVVELLSVVLDCDGMLPVTEHHSSCIYHSKVFPANLRDVTEEAMNAIGRDIEGNLLPLR